MNCRLVPFAIDAVAGVTEREVNTGRVTVNAAEPLIVPEAAVIIVPPGATALAIPPVFTVATEVTDELHCTDMVRFCVLPLLYFPVAVNCWVVPAATDATVGVTEIDMRTAALTFKVAELLIAPEEAVIVALP
jgi:hypothetical protein